VPNWLTRCACAAIGALVVVPAGRAQAARDTLTVRVHVADGPTASVDPRTALGGGVDGHRPGDIARLYTPANLRALGSAGFGVLIRRRRSSMAA